MFDYYLIAQMSMVSHKSVKLAITTGDPIDYSKLAKKESMDNVERWIVSISHTVRMIDFHQQEYRMLHERHLNGKYCPASRLNKPLSEASVQKLTLCHLTYFLHRIIRSRYVNKQTRQMVVIFRMCCGSCRLRNSGHVYQENV